MLSFQNLIEATPKQFYWQNICTLSEPFVANQATDGTFCGSDAKDAILR